MKPPVYDTAIFARCRGCGYLTRCCQCPLPAPASAPVPATGDLPDLMTPGEVAAVFRVDPKTVTRWAQQGKLRSLRTLGGHHRYTAADIQAFLQPDPAMPPPG